MARYSNNDVMMNARAIMPTPMEDYEDVMEAGYVDNMAFDMESEYGEAMNTVGPLPQYQNYPGNSSDYVDSAYRPRHHHDRATTLDEINFRLRFAHLTPKTNWFNEVMASAFATNNVAIPLHVYQNLRGYPLSMEEKLNLSGNLRAMFQNQLTQYSQAGGKELEKSIEREGRKLKGKSAVSKTLYSTGFELFTFWDSSIARIAATFGSNVASYFRFIRFLLLLNTGIGILMFSFLGLPQISEGNVLDDSIKKGFFGSLTSTIFFYGAYKNESIIEADFFYEVPLAYLMTWIAVNIVAILAIVINMYYNYRQSKRGLGDKDYIYSTLAMVGWDYSVTTRKGTRVKSEALATRIREVKKEDDTMKRTCKQKLGIWSVRVLCNLISLAILGGSGYLIFYVADTAIEPGQDIPQFIGDFFVEYQLSLVVSGLKLIIPKVLKILLYFEKYHPRTEVKLKILRTVVFYGASLVVFLISVYTITSECTSDTFQRSENGTQNGAYCCWENNLAEHIFQIALLDFIVNIGVGLLTLGVRAGFVSSCNTCQKLGYPDFDVAANILDLMYSQSLIWLGQFVAPFLAVYGMIHLFLTFYINYGLVRFCCVPSNTVFRASRSGNFFRFILLVALFFCLIPMTYGIANLAPSSSCGPFRGLERVYKTLTDRIGDSPEWLQKGLDYVSTPVVITPIIILLVLIIIYYRVKSTTHQMAAKDLQNHLQFERKVQQRRVVARTKLQKGISQQNLDVSPRIMY